MIPNVHPYAPGDRPDSCRFLRICAGLAVVASSLVASLPAQARLSVGVGRSVPLRLITTPAKKDLRTHLSQFGLRPTLVVVPSRPMFDKQIPKSYLRTLAQIDRVANKWRRAGGEVVCLDPRGVVVMADNKRKDAEVFRRVNLRRAIRAAIADDPLELILESDVQQKHLYQPFQDESVLRWVMLGKPGVITASGDDVFGKEVEAMVSELAAPTLAKEKLTRRGFKAVNEWRLGDAQREIAKLRGEDVEAALRLQQLLDSCLERHLKEHCSVLSERGLLIELGKELERLAAAADPLTVLGRKFTADLKVLRSSPPYAQAAAHLALRTKMVGRLAAAEDDVDKAYAKAAARFSGFDEVVYNRIIADHYPAAIADVGDYVRNHRASPYHREVALLLMEFQEDLQYARSVIRGKH